MTAHSSVVGGSTAGRIMNCPASLSLSRDVPPQETSEHARVGTALHSCMERIVWDELPPHDFVGEVVDGVMITDDHLDLLLAAHSTVEEVFKRFDVVDFEVEAKVRTPLIDGAFGTCDLLARGRDGTVLVLDYKFGSGVKVSAENNAQLCFYAACAMTCGGYDDWFTGPEVPVVLGIIQPAHDGLSLTDTSCRQLGGYIARLVTAVAAAQEEKPPPPNPGEWCRWCPAAMVCPSKREQARAALRLDPKQVEQLSAALELAEQLEPWIKAIRSAALKQLEAGGKVSGYKLVNRQARRRWTDEGELLELLKSSRKIKKSDYLKNDLISPAQLEKLCKRAGIDFSKFERVCESVSSGHTIAPASDKRRGVVVTSAGWELTDNLLKIMGGAGN